VRVAVDVTAIPEQVTGAGVYVLEVLEALRARTDVEVVPVRRGGLSARPVRLAWEQAVAPFVVRDADVWHGPHYTMPLLRPGPVVVTIHDLTFFDHPEWHEAKKVGFFQRMIRLSARRADVLVCVSDATARRLHELLAPTCPVVVATHGVDHARFRPEGPPSPIEGRYVLFVGTIEPRKNVGLLLDAFDRLWAQGDEVRLVLVGREGWHVEALVERLRAHPELGDRLVWAGWMPDAEVDWLYRHARAVAVPSRCEGYGLPVVEGLRRGAAVVSSTGGALTEVGGDAVTYADPDDVDAWVAALRARLLGDAPAGTSAAPPPAVTATWAGAARTIADHLAALASAPGRAEGRAR